MKIIDITETTSGGIAVVAQPVGKMIKRPNPSVFSKKKKTEDITTLLNTQPKLGKLPHEEVESVIHQWVNQEDHIELSNGMHVLSGENHGYEDNMALIVDADYKVLDNDTDIVDLMQQFTAQEIDPSIVETIVEKCWKGYKKKGMKTHWGKRVPNCVKNEDMSQPNFDFEWGEAERYPFLAKLGKEGWIELANTGKTVIVNKDNVNQIGNTGADGGETFDDLDPDKVGRFKSAIAKGTVEMPIIIKMPNGQLELVAGNTRLIGLINKEGKAKVWYIDASKLDEGKLDEGKSPHKKGTKKYKKHMAAMHAGMGEASIGAPDYNPARGGNTDNMIGEPDNYYDAEERQEAYDQLQDALEQCDRHERDYVMDGSCPACAGSGYMDGEETFTNDDGEEEESSECDGFGNYGCDEGEMTYGNDTVQWKQIMDHDYNQEIKRERESKPQPSDEILVGAMKQLHKNYVETGRFNAMELPRILRQMYPEISKQKAREIGGKFFHRFRDMNDEMSEDYNPALVTMLAKFEDECAHYYRYYGDTDMITIDKLLKAGKAEEAAEEMAGAMSDSSGGSNDFDHIYDFAKDMVDDYLHEPAMAEMRKLAGLPETEVKERTYKDVGTADMVKDRRGKEFKFHKDAKQFKSVDGEVAGLNTKLGKDLLRIRRNQMKRTTPSYPGNK